MECKTNSNLRQTFINKLTTRSANFADLSQREQFVYMFANEDNMSLTWLGKFICESFDETVLEAAFETYTDMIIRYKYIDLHWNLVHWYKVFFIHPRVYTSKCIHILLTIIHFRLPGPVYVFWLFYDVSDDYAYRTYDMAFICKSVILYKWFYTSAMRIMHVYVCTTQFDFTLTLYSTDFTWILYITDNIVYIHIRMYTCFMLSLNVCFIIL